eukprot:TRINITY_DN9721_c0_g1_i1.p1 TRINITY_DN9721_c0_g1~~TRINITY_DN9721_c0_g1_i1.p1  ORF type:complete len:497 (-),score=98.44 TRINITY_DN9721_c0_g1_i1:27-1517(-)
MARPQSSGSFVPLGSPTDLSHALFVVDSSDNVQEDDPPEDQLLFFYPPHVPTKEQVFAAGLIKSIVHLSNEFSEEAVQTIALETWKCAILAEGPYMIVLTGPITDGDFSMMQRLEDLYQAFIFFNGSFQHVMERAKGAVSEFRTLMRTQCWAPLTPLITRSTRHVWKSLHPLPHTPLPPHTNRLFLAGSQILHSLRVESPTYLGGAVFFDRTVLCTHLEWSLTRWLLGRLHHLLSSSEHVSDGSASVDDVVDRLPVFLTNAQLFQLGNGRMPTLAAPDLEQQIEMPPVFTHPHANGRYVGLYVRAVGRIAVAALVPLAALYTNRTINKMMLLTLSRLQSLDATISRTFSETAQPELLHNVTLSQPTAENAQNPYFFLAFDQLQQHARGNFVDINSEQGAVFVDAVDAAHDLFLSDPRLSQVQLKDTAGLLFARSTHGHEVFFHTRAPVRGAGAVAPATPGSAGPGSQISSAPDLGFLHIEKLARDSLSADQGIRIL